MPCITRSCVQPLLPIAFVVGFVGLATHASDTELSKKSQAYLAKLDARIDDEKRDHWSFKPVVRPEIPSVRNQQWVRSPIDAFVLARLEARDWQPAPPAESRALLRRIYLDLIGLPPTLDEQTSFLKDPSPEQIDAVVKSLLDRPGYGERWARHWLDLVRYAETNGYERDATKPHVWRYRDYVIRALNDDKPFDRFILEQLAGDELEDASSETMIATGFCRLGPWDDEPADPKTDRFDQLDDMVSTTSQVFLGLTMGCARCHNHRFEPLTMHDYYRLVAIFDPLTRPQSGRTDLDLAAGSRDQLAAQAERDRKIDEQQKIIAAARNEFRQRFLAVGKSKLPHEVIAAFRLPDGKRNTAQKELVKQHGEALEKELSAAIDGAPKSRIDKAEVEIRKWRERTPELPRGYFFHEESPQPPTTHLLLRGKPFSPGPAVQPGLPTVLVRSQPDFPVSSKFSSRRRLTLARWIADKNNPLTSRVIVNRIWQQHFGVGIVSTSSDFGTMGTLPTHPKLLDWLADWFVNEGEWSLKKLHQLIMTSNTYRMSRQWNAEYGERDPDCDLLWRTRYQRLEVEAIRDSMLAVSGRINRKMFGPSMYPYVPPAALTGHSDPHKIWKPFDEREASRRTIYAFIKRSLVVPMLEVLDLCDTTKTAAQRQVTSVAPQALTLFNGNFVDRQSKHFAARLVKEAGQVEENQVERAYLLALCRPPTESERSTMIKFLKSEAVKLVDESAGEEKPIARDVAKRRALEQMCRVIFNLNEFVYPD